MSAVVLGPGGRTISCQMHPEAVRIGRCGCRDPLTGQPAGPLSLEATTIPALIAPLGRRFERRHGQVRLRRRAAASPLLRAFRTVGGRAVVVSGGRDGTLRCWDPVAGVPMGPPVKAHRYGMTVVALGIIGGRDMSSLAEMITQCASGLQRARNKSALPFSVTSMGSAVSLSGRLMAVRSSYPVATEAEIRIWDAFLGEQIGPPLQGGAFALGTFGDGDAIFASGSGGTTAVWTPNAAV